MCKTFSASHGVPEIFYFERKSIDLAFGKYSSEKNERGKGDSSD
jgi:hypothetical protein